MLIRDLTDPALHRIYITDASVDREMAYADVYVSALEGSARSREILEGIGIGLRVYPSNFGGAGGVALFPSSPFSLGSDAGKCRSHRANARGAAEQREQFFVMICKVATSGTTGASRLALEALGGVVKKRGRALWGAQGQ